MRSKNRFKVNFQKIKVTPEEAKQLSAQQAAMRKRLVDKGAAEGVTWDKRLGTYVSLTDKD